MCIFIYTHINCFAYAFCYKSYCFIHITWQHAFFFFFYLAAYLETISMVPHNCSISFNSTAAQFFYVLSMYSSIPLLMDIYLFPILVIYKQHYNINPGQTFCLLACVFLCNCFFEGKCRVMRVFNKRGQTALRKDRWGSRSSCGGGCVFPCMPTSFEHSPFL